ncbi:MAG TPA: ATP-binding protein [Anaeromyxobacter sp.]|nr:ATP-binding protein [Anaeromyxobacter sp.]
MTSVRRKLLVALLGAVVAVTLLGVLATYKVAREQLDDIFDYHLRQIALSLSDRALARAAARRAGPELDFSIQIFDQGGVRLYLSRPEAPLPPVSDLGYSNVNGPGGLWRVYATAIGGQVIQVGQPVRVREDLAFQAATRTLIPLVLLLPLLALLVWRIVGGGLAPLRRLAGAVTARTPAALDPFGEEGVPVEALPLVRALNGLLSRLRAAMSAQRAFVADAAHELRTPLAALKLQLQLLERAPEGPSRAAALAELAAGLERGTHLVGQLLTLARLDPGAGPPPPAGPVALAELVRQAVADHALLAEAKGIDLGAAGMEEAAVTAGDAAGLRTLLANLVDNALRYTPAGGRVDVSAGLAELGPYLEVADTGPGIPAPERRRVFDRFYRVPGSAEGGSGLGLSIVKAIAERHGAAVALSDTPGGGLKVRVSFPLRLAAAGPGPRAAPLAAEESAAGAAPSPAELAGGG